MGEVTRMPPRLRLAPQGDAIRAPEGVKPVELCRIETEHSTRVLFRQSPERPAEWIVRRKSGC